MKFASNFVCTAVALLFAIGVTVHAADCQPSTDSINLDVNDANGDTVASDTYSVENSC